MKNNMHTKDSAIVAACLGSLGRLGNNILQLLFCLCISLESGGWAKFLDSMKLLKHACKQDVARVICLGGYGAGSAGP